MSDHERGAYTPPTDSPLSFDARQPVRGSRPFPFTLVIAVLVLIALAAAIFVFYRSGVRQAGQAPHTVGEPVGEMKVPPPAEAQPQDPAAGLQIYKEDQPDAPHPQFTSPPEQPQPREAPPAVVIAPPPAAAPTTPVSAAVPLRPALAAQAAPAPKAVTPPPTPAPKVVAIVPPPAPKPAPAPVAKAPAAPTPAPKASSGGAMVQIGAVSSTALADKAWSAAVAVAPGLAAGKGKSVEKIDKNGGVLYRTAVTGFASREAATAFCDKLKSAGKSCFVR
jgi:cytoskeletal protein RodZ